MKEVFDRLIEEENLDVNIWKVYLLTLESVITTYLNSKGYSYKNSEKNMVSLYADDDNTRLQQAEKLLKLKENNKESILIQNVRRVKDKIYSFLEYYNVGCLHELCLKPAGFYIEINFYISSGISCFVDKETQRLMYKRQLQILNEIGLEITEKRSSNQIKDTEKNKKILMHLFDEIGIKQADFISNTKYIQSMSAFINPEKLIGYNPSEIVIEVNEETDKKNKLAKLKQNVNELFSAIATINSNEKMINTCGYIIEHCFKSICEVFELETNLSKKVNSYHQSARNLNDQIRKMEEEVGQILDEKEIKEIGTKYLLKNGLKGLFEIGFGINEASFIGSHSAELIFESHSVENLMYSFFKYEEVISISENLFDQEIENTVNHIKSTFDLIEPFMEESYISYTEKNMQLLSEWVLKNYNTQIKSFEVNSKKGLLYIKTFSISKNQT